MQVAFYLAFPAISIRWALAGFGLVHARSWWVEAYT